MIFHVLPGDAQVEEFKRSGIDGELIVCREVLVSGPIDAEDLDLFWQERANFILAEYGEDEIDYLEKVAGELLKLTDLTPDDEVNLWFEYELFCSVNLWFCLCLISQTGARAFRVEPIGLKEENRWDGFGKFNADDLEASFKLRTKLSAEDIQLGAALWKAYRHRKYAELKDLAEKETSAFPHLAEVVAAAIEQEVRPAEILRDIVSTGGKDFSAIFIEFKKRAGVYGYGDTQVAKILETL